MSRRHLLQITGLGSLATVGAMSLAGCATGVKAPAASASASAFTGPRTGKDLQVYMNPAHVYPAYTDVFTAFEKEHGIKVTVSALQWADMITKLTAGFLAGDVPDLCEDSGTAPGWGVAGDVRNLNDFVSRDGKAMGFPDDFQQAAVDVWKVGNDTYAIPLHLTCNGLIFYNKEMLDAAGLGVPTTWDEFRSAAKALTRGGVHGAALNQDSSYTWPWLLQSGAQYYEASSKQFLTPAEDATKALQFLQDMLFKDGSSPIPVSSTDPTGPQKLLSNKQVAMMISGPWDIAPIQKAAPGLQLGLGAPLKGSDPKTSLAGAGLMIPAKAQNSELAWELLKKLTAVKVELEATKQAGMTMPRKSWGTDGAVKDDPLLSVVAKSLPLATNTQGVISQNKNLNSINTAYTAAWQQIAIQHQSVASSLDAFRNTVKAYV